MKRIIALALALIMILCAAGIAEVSAPGEFPIVNEPVELTVFYVPIDSRLEDMDTNYATKWLEEKTGIHINWVIASSSEAASQLSLILSSGANVPDVFIVRGEVPNDMVNAYGQQGMLLNLDEYIDNYGFYSKDIWSKVGETAQNECKAYDGHNYYLPRYTITFHGSVDNKLWMNYKWLENLGLEVPTTTEEFYNVLKAFKEQDANGNGDPNDELPMVFTADGWCSQVPAFLMDAFVYWGCPSGVDMLHCYVEDDNVVHSAYTEDGYREGLKFMNKLYAEGLIDNECFVLTDAQAMALASDENGNRIGCFPGGYANGIIAATAEDVYDYHTVPSLIGPTGLQEAPSVTMTPQARVFISADTEHPVEAFRWAESMMQDLPAMLKEDNYEWLNFFYGEENVGWRKANEGELGLNGGPAKYAWLFDWSASANQHWWEEFPLYMSMEYKNVMAVSAADGYDLEKVLYDETEANYHAYRTYKYLPTMPLTEDDSTLVSELAASLRPVCDEYLAAFVTGTLDINDDAVWASYIEEMNDAGMTEYIAVKQAAYDRMLAA